MKKFFSVLFTIWCAIVFVVTLVILFPLFYVLLKVDKWQALGLRLNRFWATIFFWLTGMPVKVDYKFKPDLNQAYVFVANHFTYLEIAAGPCVVKNYFTYVGKSSVGKIPLFGFVFNNLHIQVDRSNKNSRGETLRLGIKALESGRSVFIMPEGGIVSKNIPKMHTPFKDGPFIMAIKNQVCIVPISYLNFYDMNPGNLLSWGIPKAIVNQPIETKGKTKADIPALKKQVYDIIQADVDAWYGLKKTEYEG